MKLSLMTWGLAHDLALDDLLAILKRHNFAGVEFRVDQGQAHGVEPELPPERQAEVAARCADAGIEIVSIASGNRFHEQEPARRQENITRVMQIVEFAAALGAPRVRVFGNNFPEGVDRETVMKRVAQCLHELAIFAEPYGVSVDLEMHGEFLWREAVHTVELADHANLGLIFNSDPRDVQNGSVAHVFDAAGDRIKHIHMHHLIEPDFPYPAMMRLLIERGYDGYLSAEMGRADADPEMILAYYSKLFRAYVDLARM